MYLERESAEAGGAFDGYFVAETDEHGVSGLLGNVRSHNAPQQFLFRSKSLEPIDLPIAMRLACCRCGRRTPSEVQPVCERLAPPRPRRAHAVLLR
jgi:hypothetical protein